MPRYAAFLRAINVGGRRLSNEELRDHFEALGCEGVAVYQAAGNVAFEAREGSPAELARRLDAGLTERLGYECATFLRTAEEVRAIAAAEAFDPEAAAAGKVHVALLPAPPESARAERALALATDADRLAFGPCELFWLTRGRMMDATVDLAALEELVGPWTMRTKGTIERFASRHLAD